MADDPVIPGVDQYAADLERARAAAPPMFAPPAQPSRGSAQAVPMSQFDQELCARLKEMFFHYDNRRSADNRGTQTHLGPSEIGTPCDRRLAMSLMRVPPVNPGGDGWAAFVGTCIHAGLAEMFLWSSGNSGRYAVETPLNLPSVHVPKGTGDLLDRVLLCFLDHKAMGSSSLSKLRSEGIPPRYRVQVHTYGYGAVLKGERVERVGVVGWPREAATLRGLYVITEPYDEQVALDALARVDRIAKAIDILGDGGGPDGMPGRDIASYFPVADDCSFCPYHMPNAKTLEGGCNGKQ